jgi:hypothetical protein
MVLAGAIKDEPKLKHAQLREAGDDAHLAGCLQRVVCQPVQRAKVQQLPFDEDSCKNKLKASS